MSNIEQQLTRDIEAMTKGVIVTEPELLEARSALDERIDGTRRRDRRRTVVAIAAAAVVVAGAGAIGYQALGEDSETAVAADPAPTTVEDPYAQWFIGASPTPQLIAGFWREDNGGISMLFDEDGSVHFDETGRVYSGPGAWGTYEINGDTIAMTLKGGEKCKGTRFTMRASILKNGDMRALPDYGSRPNCTPISSSQLTWQHVLPTSPSFGSIPFSQETGWEPLTGKVPLNGDWAAEDGGWVIEMTPDGAYYVLNNSAEAVDQGGWSRQGGDLVLTSSAASTQCNTGDRFVLGNVQWVNPGTDVIKGTMEENSCNGTWTPKTWFLIPNNGD